MMNVGNPELAFEFSRLPNEGVGLARLEFIINKQRRRSSEGAARVRRAAAGSQDSRSPSASPAYESPTEFYVAKIVEGVATIAAAFAPKKVIVRLSDFKSNEYSNLIGGERYEPHEENPMLGFRGASRYIAPEFYDCFELECRALKRVRDDMGLTNVEIMVPFVRTVGEAEQVIELLAKNGLERGDNGLRVIMMCEIPSNAILADRFLEHFDGFSIGSNDMTQLTLAVDRDAGGAIASTFDERDDAVKAMLAMAIAACRKAGKYAGICGQGPSDHPGSRAMAGRAEDREHVAQSGHRRRNLARAGQASALRRRSSRKRPTRSRNAAQRSSAMRPIDGLRAPRDQSHGEDRRRVLHVDASTIAHRRVRTRRRRRSRPPHCWRWLPGEPGCAARVIADRGCLRDPCAAARDGAAQRV